ncbi:putative polysaccharide biosynthesis protein [Metabacillus sp. HB246100]
MNVPKNNLYLAMQGAMILTLAGLVTKILSAAYRVPYQNIVGDIGFYIYQQVYPFYGMSVILATSGFPVIISKVIVDLGHNTSKATQTKILTVSFWFLAGLGFFMFLPLFLFALQIAQFMGDVHLAPLIKVTSFSFLLIPFLSTYRGVFQAQQDMKPTAISQVIEQGVRVSFILVSSFLMIKAGFTLYETGVGAFFSSILGSVAALLFFFFYSNKKHEQVRHSPQDKVRLKTLLIIRKICKYSFTIGICSLLLILIQLIDSLHLYALLTDMGIDEETAKRTKGIYDRGQPLIQLGTVVATSFALSIVPVLSTAKADNHTDFITKKIHLSIKLCLVIASGATIGLIAIMKPTNIMLFTDSSGSFLLMILIGSIFFTSLCLTLFAILQGLDFTVFPAITVLVGTLIKLLVNSYLVPIYGIYGAASSTTFAYFVVALSNYVYLAHKGYVFKEYKALYKIVGSNSLMVCSILIYLVFMKQYGLAFDERMGAAITALAAVVLGGFVYGIMILKLKVFSREELVNIPIINKVMK